MICSIAAAVMVAAAPCPAVTSFDAARNSYAAVGTDGFTKVYSGRQCADGQVAYLLRLAGVRLDIGEEALVHTGYSSVGRRKAVIVMDVTGHGEATFVTDGGKRGWVLETFESTN